MWIYQIKYIFSYTVKDNNKDIPENVPSFYFVTSDYKAVYYTGIRIHIYVLSVYIHLVKVFPLLYIYAAPVGAFPIFVEARDFPSRQYNLHDNGKRLRLGPLPGP